MKNGTVNLLLQVGKLKTLKRSAWVLFKMPDPESVAEHVFRICFLIFLLGDKLGVSREKLYEMALVHDIEEIETGDPITQRGAEDIGEHDHKLEREIVRRLTRSVDRGEDIYKLWEAHLPQNKPGAPREASVLYQLGKIATAWQALEYELAGVEVKELDELWENARTHVKDPFLLELLNVLEERRTK